MSSGGRQAASCGWRRSIGRLPDGRVYLPLTPLTRNLPANYLRPSVDAILASVSPNCVATIVALSLDRSLYLVASLRELQQAAVQPLKVLLLEITVTVTFCAAA